MRQVMVLPSVLLLGCSACGSTGGGGPAAAAGGAAGESGEGGAGGARAEQPGRAGPPGAEAVGAGPALRHVVCAWGGVGIRVEPPPAWVVGLVDLEVGEPLRGLAVERVEIFDAAGALVATTVSELELRRSPPGRGERDYSRDGTTELEDPIRPGTPVRLWHHGRLDRSQDEVTARSPTRYRATFRTGDGRTLTVEGALDPPWPTA